MLKRVEMSARLAALMILSCVLNSAAAADEPKPDDVRALLDRMNNALATRNYQGTYFHLRNGKAEWLGIFHRVENGRVSERLVSLDGSSRREIIRNDDELTCILPDQRRVVVETRPARGPLLGGVPVYSPGLERYYQLKLLQTERLLDRNARVVQVEPRDAYRFGYKLWIDEETSMPLKTQLCDSAGNVIEQVAFASIAMPERMPKSLVQPQIQTEGFKWTRQQPQPPATVQVVQIWRAVQVPPGFRLTATSAQLPEGAKNPVSHLVYSDGLASVSVFIEVQTVPAARVQGPQRLGSSVAFFTAVKGHQVTAVGEVPMQTVRLIAHSTQPTERAGAVPAVPPATLAAEQH